MYTAVTCKDIMELFHVKRPDFQTLQPFSDFGLGFFSLKFC